MTTACSTDLRCSMGQQGDIRLVAVDTFTLNLHHHLPGHLSLMPAACRQCVEVMYSSVKAAPLSVLGQGESVVKAAAGIGNSMTE
mmetsp:Transcript_107116/g.212651  ORF Transcript_107116/g.212651 Transcript_107116/m.212651 type:complete len:85 (+) Transcript_107116:774-1028(+)